MSRRPKPTAIKELEGNQSHRPLNPDEPKVDPGAPEMPKELRPAAQREWRRMVAFLMPLGVLTPIDGKALMMYCDSYADWEVAQRQCVKEGMWVEEPIVNKDGNIVGYKFKQAPWFNVKCAAEKIMKSNLIEFGMTPASRAKLHIPAKPKVDPAEDKLFSRDAVPPANDEPNLDDIDETVVN